MRKLNPLILDLKGLVMNSYHAAMSPEYLTGTTKEKINTAEFGFETWLSKFFDPAIDIAKSPINIIAVIDDGNTYRKSLYPAYKQKRGESQATQDPLEKEQINKCMAYSKNFLAALGVPIVRLKGQEADDVIAYLAQNLRGRKTIFTIDKDLLVLANASVGVFINGMHKTAYAIVDGEVPAHLVSLYLSLVGDTSDGYPGIKGLGPKAWLGLQDTYGVDGMEQLLSLIADDKRIEFKAIVAASNNKTMTKLAENYHDWRLMYTLARLHPEICEGAKVALEWYKRAPTLQRLTKVMSDTGTLDMIVNYDKWVYKTTLVTKDNLEKCFGEIDALTSETLAVSWDYETVDHVKNPDYITATKSRRYVDVLNSEIAGCSFALGANMNHVYYFSVEHKDTPNVDKSVVLDVIKHFEAEGIELVVQNYSFEATVTKVQLNHDLKYSGDTKAFAHHLDENSPNGLKALSKRYLNYDQTSYEDTLGDAVDMSEISGAQVLKYGCDDSLVTGHLYQLFTWMTQLEGTYDFIMDYECPSAAEMIMPYIHGIMLDPEEMATQTAADQVTVVEKMATMRELLATYCINPNFDAVEMLFGDQRDYLTYKAKQKFVDKPVVDQEEIADGIKHSHAEYRLRLKENSRYIAPYKTRVAADWLPTPAKMTKLNHALGLPDMEKVTKIYLCDFISHHQENPDLPVKAAMMLKLLCPAIDELAKRKGEAYEAFKTFAEGIFYETSPVTTSGTELNLGSPHQMLYLMYLMLGLPVRIRTKVQKGSARHQAGLPGSPAGNKAAIDFALANDCEGDNAWKAQLLKALSDYTKAATRLSIYWGPYPLWMGEDFVIHPNFLSPGTVTRRPTGSSPNLLQVSKGKVRNCFIPRSPDNVIASADFASQELRVMAAATMDENFLSAYMGADGDKDLHAMTACGIVTSVLRMYPDVTLDDIKMDGDKVDYDWFKEHQDDDTPLGYMLRKVRGISKTVNFGAGYGAVGATVSQQAMIPLDIADLAVDGMLATYPGINLWKKKIYAFAKQHGFVATTYGSRRHCGNALNAGNRSDVGRWERQLSNFLIQGQCADLLKVVLANAHKTQLFKKHGAMLLAPVYDEILAEVPKASLHAFLHDLSDLMEINMPGIVVPMVADCSIGDSWGNQVEVGSRPTLEKINEALLKLKFKVRSEKSCQESVDEAYLDDDDDLSLD